MILPTDIPTRAQLERLLAARHPSSVSIYLPTEPAARGDAERIELKNLAREASTQLEQAGTAKADVAAIDDEAPRRNPKISSRSRSSGVRRPCRRSIACWRA